MNDKFISINTMDNIYKFLITVSDCLMSHFFHVYISYASEVHA